MGCDMTANDMRESPLDTFGQRDALTGFYDRASIRNLAERCFLASDVRQSHALFVVDVDNFRKINETLGRSFGDAILSDIAWVLRRTFRRSDSIGRVGSDVFVVLLKDVQIGALSEKKAREFCVMLRTLSAARGKTAPACSIGVAFYPENGVTFETVYRCADAALHEARKLGRNQVVFASRAV